MKFGLWNRTITTHPETSELSREGLDFGFQVFLEIGSMCNVKWQFQNRSPVILARARDGRIAQQAGHLHIGELSIVVLLS